MLFFYQIVHLFVINYDWFSQAGDELPWEMTFGFGLFILHLALIVSVLPADQFDVLID